ncbi:unnamed protein product [Lampetra fluviatilis]
MRAARGAGWRSGDPVASPQQQEQQQHHLLHPSRLSLYLTRRHNASLLACTRSNREAREEKQQQQQLEALCRESLIDMGPTAEQ